MASTGTVQLVRTSVSGNEIHGAGSDQAWSFGGGVWAAALDATDSHVDENQTSLTAGYATNLLGAGVLADEAVIVRSSIDRNIGTSNGDELSGARGGGLNIDGDAAIADSSVSNNQLTANAADGHASAGAIGAGTLQLDRSTLTGNEVEATHEASGAGASVFNTVAIEGSRISGNSASASADDGIARGGGLAAGGGDISSSTVDGNVASAPALAQAGGVLHTIIEVPEAGPLPLAITNSTVSANRASSESQPSVGGGIAESTAGSTVLRFATVGDNAASSGANLAGVILEGRTPSGPLAIQTVASVISDPLGGGSNCATELAFTDQGFTHVTDTSCGTTAAPDPQLGALDDNGGPTETMLPALTSPLLDRVPNDACTAITTTDQRNITRPEGNACDIGAVEVEVTPADPPLAPPDTPITPAADSATAPVAIVAEPRFTG
jgi:hypothetical protein